MKSNISQKEINSGKKNISLLKKPNPILSPHLLNIYIPEYKYFFPNINQYGLWISPKLNKKTKQEYNKIFFLLSGLAASGKDSIYNEMTKLIPNLFFKSITATTRPPRENEKNNLDYYFYKNKFLFKSDIKNDKFVEYIKRGQTYYGLPKKSLKHAFKQPNPIIYCQIEISGWENLEKYLFSLNKNILIIKSFVLPHLTLSNYLNWLTQNRKNEEITSRINKSGWEIKIAPQKADFLISNRINQNSLSLNYTAKTILNLLTPFLKSTKFKKFAIPTDKFNKTKNVSKIIKVHNSLI